MDLCGFDGFGSVLGEKVRQPVASDYTGVVALLEAFDLGTSKFEDWMTRWLLGLNFDGFHRF